MTFIFVDVEARGQSPINGTMTEFGAVEFKTRQTFHGRIWEGTPDPANPAFPVVGKQIHSPNEVMWRFATWIEMLSRDRPVFVSDNPAYDFMWIAAEFDRCGMKNPFGHSARRISDFYAGLMGDFSKTQEWKKLRVTPHDHNPVNDAMGNVEAMHRLLAGER